MIKDLIDDEKPRERLIKFGVENISNEDLISIILKTGTYNISVKELSINILSKFNNISDLKNITINNINDIKGVGKVKAITLIAALELGRRVYYEKNIEDINIKNSDDIYNYFKYLIKDNDQERFYAIYLDIKKKVIDKKLLFVGTVNMSLVHPREVFKYAYLNSASFIICIHNHPSGDIT
ncbi:MAG: DNA repair protein RadC, partial [Bacilli bacterium]|nr:DNA repair protein RadC [Bacilli bacterium]